MFIVTYVEKQNVDGIYGMVRSTFFFHMKSGLMTAVNSDPNIILPYKLRLYQARKW